MKLIAHRGNFSGRNVSGENSVEYIKEALVKNFDVEVDLWNTPSGLFLGHDKPDHSVDVKFLENFKHKLWIHAKSIDTIEFLSKTDFHWFWHESDKITLTSQKVIWTYSEIFIENSVVNQPSENSLFWRDRLWEKKIYHGICHDNLLLVKYLIDK